MIKSVKPCLWAFDVEWVPDPVAGRLLHDIPDTVTDPREVMNAMWRAAGASAENPTPFLKTVVCRIVSLVALERRVEKDGAARLELISFPRDCDDPTQTDESALLTSVFERLGQDPIQLVGFNSIQSDLKILVQRGIVNGIQASEFCRRPDKPWEGIDYFARGTDWNVDLKDIIGGFGKATPSLHEIATVSGIPGKMGVDGDQVAGLWLANKLADIVRYNEQDALTTYLVFLRLAHFAGHFTTDQYAAEQELVRVLLRERSTTPSGRHFARYLEEWNRLSASVAGDGKPVSSPARSAGETPSLF